MQKKTLGVDSKNYCSIQKSSLDGIYLWTAKGLYIINFAAQKAVSALTTLPKTNIAPENGPSQ